MEWPVSYVDAGISDIDNVKKVFIIINDHF